jgi:hypothetical protein
VTSARSLALLPLRPLLVVLIAASACDRTSDLPRLQDEALAAARDYQQRFDELAHRAEALPQRSTGAPAGAPYRDAAQLAFRQAVVAIEEHRQALQQISAKVQTAAKSGNPRT